MAFPLQVNSAVLLPTITIPKQLDELDGALCLTYKLTELVDIVYNFI
jgi:hypothetical protein